MKEWQFNILFFVGVGAAIAILFGDKIGLDITKNPTAVTGVGMILTYVLSRKDSIVKSSKKDDASSSSKEENKK